jgi:hypothetical protein
VQTHRFTSPLSRAQTGYDPFKAQKRMGLHGALEPLRAVAARVQEIGGLRFSPAARLPWPHLVVVMMMMMMREGGGRGGGGGGGGGW